MEDPFASAVENDVETPTVDEVEEAPKRATRARKKASEDAPAPEITEGPKGRVSATFKAGSGYDAEWIVIEGDSVATVYEMINTKMLAALMEKTNSAAAYFRKGFKGGTRPAASGGGQKSSGGGRPKGNYNKGGGGGGNYRKKQAEEFPDVEQEYCDHGEMVPKSGESARGPWHAWACPDGDKSCWTFVNSR